MKRFMLSASTLLALTACAATPFSAPSEPLRFEIVPVAASLETDPMVGTGDRADDPAIWVNTADTSASLILGTNKDEGLHVYTLSGEEIQFLDVGQLNNVDVRGDLVVASNDEVEALSWFTVTASVEDPVLHLGDTPVETTEPYGVCLGLIDGAPTAGVTYKDGTVQLWTVDAMIDKDVTPVLTRTAKLATQLEGCAFDDAHKRLFIGEETHGIWSLDLSDPAALPVSVDTIANGNGLVEDVEGLSLWEAGDGSGYLVASAQAADRFVVYDRLPPHAPRGVITIAASPDGLIDAVSHTDGLDVISTPLPGYPRGLLVVQDDANPKKSVDQNFKLIDWAAVETALGLTAAD